jgi:hypothetical protein
MNRVELVQEAKIHRLLPDCDEDRRLEASGVTVRGEELIVIFDNESRLARIDRSLAFSAQNGWLGREDDSTGVEDVAYDARRERFYLLIEALPAGGETYQAAIVEYDVNLKRLECNRLPYDFASDNKGFEGLVWLERDGDEFVLALCEGNRCKGGREGREPGNGWIQVFRRVARGWEYVDRLTIPATAQFADYASIAVRDGCVAVLSQESSLLWLGTLADAGWAFVDEGAIFALPRDAEGEVIHCNAEGVAWLASGRVAVVSDRRKKDGPKRCAKKDQSITIFDLRLG